MKTTTQTKETKMYRIHFTNHDYFSPRTFTSFEEALNYGKSTTFEFGIYKGNELIAGYGIFRGLTMYQES